MEFEKILRELLEEKNVTQKQLADAIKIGASTLSNYVQGTRQPDFDALKAIADYFKVSTDFLLDHRTGQAISHGEDVLLRVFRALTPEYREIYLRQGKAFLAQSHKTAYEHKLRTTEKSDKHKKGKD